MSWYRDELDGIHDEVAIKYRKWLERRLKMDPGNNSMRDELDELEKRAEFGRQFGGNKQRKERS